MDWGMPQNFIWLWTLPAIMAAFLLSSLRKRSQMRRFGEVAMVERLLGSFDARKRFFKRALFVAAAFCMVLALCQPHWKKKETLVERRGIDVFIAIDVSNSMLAKDIPPNRLEKAKLELAGLVDRLKGDRIGIIAFAGDAYIQCPLTLDRGAVKIFLSTVNPNLVTTQGTVLTNAIKVALQAFSDKTAGNKALILLTDGEDHEGDAIKAARRAKEQGVRIFTIGIGTPEGRTLPDETGQGIKKDAQGRPVISKLNEDLLKRLAREADGSYFRAPRGDLAVDRIVRDVRGITPKGSRSEWSIEYEENYQTLVLAAILLLFLEMFVSERRKAEAP